MMVPATSSIVFSHRGLPDAEATEALCFFAGARRAWPAGLAREAEERGRRACDAGRACLARNGAVKTVPVRMTLGPGPMACLLAT